MKQKIVILAFTLLTLGLLSQLACTESFECGSASDSNLPPTPIPGPCRADFYAEPTHKSGTGNIHFYSTSTGNIKTYRWDFGNGQQGVGASPTSFYSKNGYYTITLVIEGPDCYDTMTKVDYIEITGC